MDFHIAGQGADFHVLTTHTAGPNDASPLQFISAARLAELKKSEDDLAILRNESGFAEKRLAITPQKNSLSP